MQELSSSLGFAFDCFSHSLSFQLPKNGAEELSYQRCHARNSSQCKGSCLQRSGAIAFACDGALSRAVPGTGKVNVEAGEELLTVSFFPYSETSQFTYWCNVSWSHLILSQVHGTGDFPNKANEMSGKFTCAFFMSTAHLLDHPTYPEVEGLDI